MVTQQEAPSTKNDLEAGAVPTISSVTGQYEIYDYETFSHTGETIAMNPVVYESGGEGLFLHPKFMNVGQPYSFVLDGHTIVVIKKPDGTIDFYFLH